jgi:hypothetical protein
LLAPVDVLHESGDATEGLPPFALYPLHKPIEIITIKGKKAMVVRYF